MITKGFKEAVWRGAVQGRQQNVLHGDGNTH